MSRQNIHTDYKFTGTDGFMLTDMDTDKSIMLIPSDTAGNFSWTGVTRAPLTRNALQTSNTNNQYSDLELPWISIPQEDWTGGRGNAIFTKDTTRYMDGKRCQAGFNSVIYNAPLDYYSTGFRDAITNCPGSLYWEPLTEGKYIAVAITPSKTISARELYIHLRRRGKPSKPLYVRLQDSLSGSSSILYYHNYTTDEITDTLAEFRKWVFSSELTMTANHTYYLVVFSPAGDEEDHWEVGCKKGTNTRTTFESNKRNDDYEPVEYELYYRIAEYQSGYMYKFFEYEQLPMCARWFKNTGNTTTLWVNGDIGRVTSVSTTSVTDSSKNWPANCYAGARIGLVYGQGIQGRVSVWRTIESNTSNTITVDRAWDAIPSVGATFIINDTPLWKEITGHGLTKPIKDVHVARGRVLFAQGCWETAREMRWAITTGGWEFRDMEGTGADFFQTVRDSAGLMLWRGRNYGDSNYRRTVDRCAWLDWTAVQTMCEITEAISTEKVDDEPNERSTVFSTSVDFGQADYDFQQYICNISNFTSKYKTGRLIITLQESEDNKAFHDVQSVTADSKGKWYIFAHCQYRYRRLKFAASGEDCVVNNITCTTSQKPHWEDPIALIDNYGKITRLFEYGAEQYKCLWIAQEGNLSSVNKVDGTTDTYTLDRINLDELATTAEEWNSKAMTTTDVYLAFAWLNGLQRYYNTQLEGKGPDHDEGLPFERQGRVTQIIAYPSNLFISIDGGANGYSTVMMFNQSGWHEIYRAPNKGERIYDMMFQPIYGERPDRLWMNVGDDIVWLAMPSKILYAIQDANAEYTHESVLVSAWHTAGMIDIEKLWQSLKIMADYLDGENCWIEADYQVDEEEEWHPIDDWYGISPSQKEDFEENKSVNGKKLRYRLRLQTTDMHKTPKVNAVVIEAVGRVDIKYSYNFYFRNIKYKRDLNAEFEDIEPIELQELLDEWANGLRKLRLNSRWKIFDDKIVYLDAVQTSVLNEVSEGYLGQITLNEL